MFEYDVALSFAGEQRAEVLQVAECLKKAGVRVFYDEDEKATLWGKNLYDHLSDIYQHKARYCVIFASREYAEKTWTNLERQNAQARALQNKSAEYILPVRFDATEIPGLLPSIGYLDFRREGPSGICAALLAKLGKTPPASPSFIDSLSYDLSPRAMIHALDGRIALPVVESCQWGEEIRLSVAGSDNDAFFTQLREQRPEVVIAYHFDVAIAKPTVATRQVAKGVVTWDLSFVPTRTDFSNFMEPGSGGTSADEFARMRAERLLLNQHVHTTDTNAPTLHQVNDTMREVLIRGMNTAAKIERSPFPDLYGALKSEPRAFLETAWIVAAAKLRLSASVEVIDKFVLTLTGKTLQVAFAGRRRRQYVNVEPYEIRIQGAMELES